MANMCMSCRNWRKCPWSENLDLSFEKRKKIPDGYDINGSPVFDEEGNPKKFIVKRIKKKSSSGLGAYRIDSCPMADIEDDNERPRASALNDIENEKFLRNPHTYLDRHSSSTSVTKEKKRREDAYRKNQKRTG